MRRSASPPEARPRAAVAALALAALALAVLALVGCGGTSPGAGPGARPDVLVILVDALRADRLGVNGYPLRTTPSIDRLAAEGVTFTHAFAHSTWTKASIATLFTSLYPSQHGIERVGFLAEGAFRTEVLSDDALTLAEAFSAAGYATGGVLNQVHLKARFGFAQGFEHFEAVRGQGAYNLNRRLRAWLETLDERPFFAYLHYLDAHWPYTMRVETERFGPTAMDSEPPRRGDRAMEWARQRPSAADLAALEARYDHEVAFTDAAIGELIRTLQELGRYEDTLIVVTSDHGEGFFEHGRIQHAYEPYEELLRVPWVMRLPERLRTEVRRVDEPVGLVDVMPTLLELVGLEPPEQCQGLSAVPLLHGAAPGERLIFAETSEAAALRAGSHKLIRFLDGRTEFYDLAADPAEQRPLPGPCEGPCEELSERLAELLAALERSRAGGVGSTEMGAEEIEDLRSLGYL